jgi:predicted nuclease of restriction endonuclease-like (RecB) superfamily
MRKTMSKEELRPKNDAVINGLDGYADFLADVKNQIQTAQVRAALSVSQELVRLYWQIGRDIVSRQQEQGWGQAVIARLAADLQKAFPGVQGFSARNLERMRAFFLAYPEENQFATQPVSQIPWGHNIILFQKVKDPSQRLWYASTTVEHGWSRAVLEMQIESRLYERQGKATTNFSRTLPPLQSDLAQAILKDPYNFDFLTLSSDAHERDVEQGLLGHIRRFLLELGAGFAFVGSQYHLEVEGQDYYLDLLFYHLKLRCYVVIDLKAVAFQPEFVGKMNFYLAAVDDTLRHEADAPSIGLLLCRKKQALTVEYALRNVSTPIGVAEFITDLARQIEGELNSAQIETTDDAADQEASLSQNSVF